MFIFRGKEYAMFFRRCRVFLALISVALVSALRVPSLAALDLLPQDRYLW
jgi:hypothetical protein